MNTDARQQIETALWAFSGSDLRAASIGLLNSLGDQSEKTLDLDNTPDAFLAEFEKRDRKFRKDKALLYHRKSVEFLYAYDRAEPVKQPKTSAVLDRLVVQHLIQKEDTRLKL
ncbi:MAG: hypothetical protein DRG58_05490 [Deltaproteobacteria bacterium]|nr:MAG: hypothetical protein DRG58_05490 [Deltaproteobacteria bacterium]